MMGITLEGSLWGDADRAHDAKRLPFVAKPYRYGARSIVRLQHQTPTTMTSTKFQTVDAYIATFPAKTKTILKSLRTTIKETAPQAEEVISYNMPAFKLDGILVWYAAYKEHIGFYPKPSAIEKFRKELAGYKQSKGAIQFPIDAPLPLTLVTKIVKYRIRENQETAKAK